MKVHNKKTVKDVYSIYNINILNFLLEIFALKTNDLINPKRKCGSVIKSVVTATILGVWTSYSLYYKINYLNKNLNLSIMITDTFQALFDYCQYLVDLYFIYKYGADTNIQYQKQYERIDKILAMVNSGIMKRLNKQVGLFSIIWVTTAVSDYIAWSLAYGWIIPLVYAIAYLFLFIKIVTTLDLTCQVIHIESRLKIMGDVVQNYHSSIIPEHSTLGALFDDSINNKIWFYFDESSHQASKQLTQVHSLKIVSHNDYHEIKWLTRCYLLLIEQCTFTNKMFGFRILLNSLSLLIDMVRFTNVAVRIAIGAQRTTYDAGYFPAVTSVMRLLTCAAVLTSLVSHCEGAYRQSERILSIIDHILINKNPSDELRSALTELRDLIQSRPVSFSVANFFQLNYSFLASTVSVVVTYSIILLQSMN